MVRIALADEHLLTYLTEVSKQNVYTVGLILGQTVAGKDYVIHLAKTPPGPCGDGKVSRSGVINNINDVSDELVQSHARQAARALPGGMYVLGIFLLGPKDLLSPFSPKVKNILIQIHKDLEATDFIYGNASGEKLVLNYCSRSGEIVCKNFDVESGNVKPAEIKLMQNAMKWIQIECKYLIDTVYCIKEDENNWPLRKQMGIVVDQFAKNLQQSKYFFDGDARTDDDSIQNIRKSRSSRNTKCTEEPSSGEPIQISIFQPCTKKDRKDLEIRNTGNEICVFGNVVSKLWLNPNTTVAAATKMIREDILRSLSARLELHWDSLIGEEDGGAENSVHEPPRRVLIPLPNVNIEMSEYLFPGEGAQDAQESLEETLDVQLPKDSGMVDLEGLTDLNEYYKKAIAESESEEVICKMASDHNNKSLFPIVLTTGIIVLILSLIIHFWYQK